ncbi:MAG: signal peptidase I [Christensenella sp.]|nr:signal peptidase I [Christensenella sp.]
MTEEASDRKEKYQQKKNQKAKSIWGWVLAIAIAVAAAFLIRAFLFEIILVDGPSMQPTLQTNERLAVEKVTRYASLPQRGDIIIVHYPNGTDNNYVKRAIGLPGETIEIKDSIVYVDGQPLQEDYISLQAYPDMAAITVPGDAVFVLGDNRANSTDSRVVGPIPHDMIVGHAMAVIWPVNEWRTLN